MDQDLNVLDIVIMVDFILGYSIFTDDQLIICDVNDDGSINVIDVVSVLQIILNN